jgi:hypothetical protein
VLAWRKDSIPPTCTLWNLPLPDRWWEVRGRTLDRGAHIDLLMHLFAALYDCQKVDQRPPLVVCQRHCLPVRYPQVNSTAPRVHPKQMLVAKLLSYGRIEHTDRCADEAPAAFAYVCARTTSSDAVVIRHIDIKDELSLNGSKCARSHRLLVPRLEKMRTGNSKVAAAVIIRHALVRCRRVRSQNGWGSACTSAS